MASFTTPAPGNRRLTYDELTAEIIALNSAGDFPGIARLITRENIQTIQGCENKPITPPFQNITDLPSLVADYYQLLTNLSIAGTLPLLLSLFTPGNILLQEIGAEYEAAIAIAEEAFTELGHADPTTDAETAAADYTQTLFENQTAQQPQPC